MHILKRALTATAATLVVASAVPASAQESPPGPPADFWCNGVTCEGYVVTGYDPITGNPILSYIVLPDVNFYAPAPI